MASEQSRMECLRIASERLGPTATHEQLWAEANILLAYVDGYDRIDTLPDGTVYVGRKV